MKRTIQTVLLLIITMMVVMPSYASANPLAFKPPASFAVTAQAADSPSGFQKIVTKTRTTWPWYVTRASGLVASALLIILIIFGIGLVTGYTYRLMEPVSAWAVHRALGLALGVSILVHVFSLLFDKYEPFTILQVLMPFMSHYRPVTIWGIHLGSLYVAFGVLAFYAAGIIIVSSLVWMEKKPVIWRLLHYTGYLLVLLVFLHGLYLGSDLQHGLFRALWLGAGIIVIAAGVLRLRRVRTLKKDKP